MAFSDILLLILPDEVEHGEAASSSCDARRVAHFHLGANGRQ
jgi:hypothetical protein